MNTLLPPEKLQFLVDQTARAITERTSGVLLNPKDVPLEGKVCTVYTDFYKNIHSGLAMYAPVSLFTRMTKHMMQSDNVTVQDIEDFSKEYFNILCGHIASVLFQHTKTSVRFTPPVFYHGFFSPDNRLKGPELRYQSDHQESARLIHFLKPQ